MKKLIFILLFTGSICQGQAWNRCIATCDNIVYLNARIDSLINRIEKIEKGNNLDPDSLSDPSIYPFDRYRDIHPIMNYDSLEPVPSWVLLPDNIYMPKNDTISWFDYYDCLIPPKDKSVTVWHKGNADIFYKVDSITFKDK